MSVLQHFGEGDTETLRFALERLVDFDTMYLQVLHSIWKSQLKIFLDLKVPKKKNN